MPHKCVRCGKTYGENAIELIRGCGCGARIFLYMKKQEDLDQVKNSNWIEQELRKISDRKNDSRPICLEIENVRLLEKGVFELNLESLIKNRDPVIVKDSYGVYYVRLPQKESSVLSSDQG